MIIGPMNSFTPKIFTTMREGYDLKLFKADSVAGLTVAIVALPLSMAWCSMSLPSTAMMVC